MPGKKQHFIPKHFLKGFVVPDGNDKLWMFRRESAKPVAVSISDAAAKRYFYSKPTNSNIPTLDDSITEYENQLKCRVEKLRTIQNGEIIPAHLISEVAAHLMVRAEYVREIVNLCFSAAITSTDELATAIRQTYEVLETNRHRVPFEFEDVLIEKFKSQYATQPLNIPQKALARIMYFRLRENSSILKGITSREMHQLFSNRQSDNKNISRETHNEALWGELVPVTLKARLEKFHWRVVEHPTASAVLPDCIVIAKDRTGWSPAFIAEINTITQVVLPIAANKLAVGCIDQSQNVAVDMYNHTAKKCCFKFYLSNDPREVLDRDNAKIGDIMHSRVGDFVSAVSKKPIKDFFGVAATDTDKNFFGVASADTDRDRDRDSPISEKVNLASKPTFFYSIQCDDFDDQDFLEDVSNQLNSIIDMFIDSYPMHGLHGFSFVKDHTDFLKILDRGDGVNRKFLGDKSDGIAVPISAEQKNRIATRVVLKTEIAKCLLSQHEAEKLRAVSAIAHCLGSVAFYALIDGKFPGKLLSPASNLYEGYLYLYNDALLPLCFPNYLLVTREADIKNFADHALERLDEMVTKTLEAYNDRQANCNRQDYFKKSAYHVSSFLFSLARFVGATAATGEPRMLDSALDDRLRQLELSQWFKLFEKDLLAFYHNVIEWGSWDEIYFINRHFERILFDVGIITCESIGSSLGFFVHNEHKLSANAGLIL